MLCSKLALTVLRLTSKDIPEFFNIGNSLRWLDDLGHDHAPKKIGKPMICQLPTSSSVLSNLFENNPVLGDFQIGCISTKGVLNLHIRNL